MLRLPDQIFQQSNVLQRIFSRFGLVLPNILLYCTIQWYSMEAEGGRIRCPGKSAASVNGEPMSGKVTLVYPSHLIKPEDFLTFIELDGFSNDWKSLGLGDEDLSALQWCLMCGPDRTPVIKGTGGLRKVRFAPHRWGTGKSGAARICYVYFPMFSAIVLITAYSKGEQENISAAHRAAYKRLIERAERLLESRTYR